MPISTIVVGVDHSDRSDKAMRKANEIALFHDAGVVVEYALDVGSSQKLRGLLERVALEETEERAQLILGDQAARFEVKAAAGRPHEILRDVAKQCGADLIVLGVHRRDKSPAVFAGSTARRLINDAPAPVLVVTTEPAGAYRRVLVGYDDSPASRAGAQFTIVTACMIPFSSRHEEDFLVKQFEADARRMVLEALGRDGNAGADKIAIIARVGEAFGAIMDAQREIQPDLLVLGTSMPAMYRQVFGGGIVDLIAADPPCDLLVVKT